MSRKKIISIAAVLIIIASAVIYFKWNSNQELIKPTKGKVIESIYGLGTVSADEVFNVRLGISTTIGQLFVKEGDLVNKGDRLVRIDNHIMTAPIQGTITRVAYKDGELVTPQVTVLTVTNLKKLYLEVNLEQQSILRIKPGQEVNVSFETLRSEKFVGLVKTIYPRENQFIVRIELSNWPTGVLPGMTADVAILVGQKDNVLLIPIKSISSGMVTRVRNGKREKVKVQLGVIDGERAELTSDNITESDELLIRK